MGLVGVPLPFHPMINRHATNCCNRVVRPPTTARTRRQALRVSATHLCGVLLLGVCCAAFGHTDQAYQRSSEHTLSPSADIMELRAAVERLQAENAHLRRHTRVRDMLGGLGLLAGIFGVGYYVAARRVRRDSQ